MNELERLLHELDFVWKGDHEGYAWYGPAILPQVQKISPPMAKLKVKGAHSIGELALHMASWHREVARRLRERDRREPEDGDWPLFTDWEQAQEKLVASYEELRASVASLKAADLEEYVGRDRNAAEGTGVTVRGLIHGILQHSVYHLGQISLLRRALESA